MLLDPHQMMERVGDVALEVAIGHIMKQAVGCGVSVVAQKVYFCSGRSLRDDEDNDS